MLAPLFEDTGRVVINGDSMDTRTSVDPERTRRDREDTLAFFKGTGVPVTLVTGNHDPDISDTHSLDLADGRVFLTHGDVLFADIVPWGRDRKEIFEMLQSEFSRFPEGYAPTMDERLKVYRKVAAAIPQRHQSERNLLKYAFQFARDTVWPPGRVFKILKAWRDVPKLASDFALKHRPNARFVLFGHTHRPGIWHMEGGPTVINTGSFTPPLGGYAIDLDDESLTVRKVALKKGSFQVTDSLARFSLA
jgi:predicted phosphodiesterase